MGNRTRDLSVCSTVSQLLNPLHSELNPIYHLLALLGTHHILHVSRVRVKGYVIDIIAYRYLMCLKRWGRGHDIDQKKEDFVLVCMH